MIRHWLDDADNPLGEEKMCLVAILFPQLQFMNTGDCLSCRMTRTVFVTAMIFLVICFTLN